MKFVIDRSKLRVGRTFPTKYATYASVQQDPRVNDDDRVAGYGGHSLLNRDGFYCITGLMLRQILLGMGYVEKSVEDLLRGHAMPISAMIRLSLPGQTWNQQPGSDVIASIPDPSTGDFPKTPDICSAMVKLNDAEMIRNCDRELMWSTILANYGHEIEFFGEYVSYAEYRKKKEEDACLEPTQTTPAL